MKQKESKSKRTLSWIFEEPLAYTIPSLHLLDDVISCFSRILYIVFRIFLRLILGNDRRKEVKVFHIITASAHVSFSFWLFMFLYKVIRRLKLGNPSLVQIDVPKYNFKVYCPVTLDDYMNMTLRERDIIEHFNPDKDDTVIDIGAHLGRYTLISANKVGKEGRVIAIEANPLVFKKLKSNLELNGFTNVTCLNCAVYSAKKKIKLFFPSEGLKNTLYNTTIVGRSVDFQKYIEVNAESLDNILNSLNINPMTVNWIKIDVEGAELEVLKGATNLLYNSRNISLLIEVHNISEGESLYEDIMMLLISYNFQLIFEKIYESGERHIIARKKQIQ